ncbi:MAG: bifunctional methionine sulfoxide reductase B/A protein [Flavobacteriales bacterium]|nr:bifunctional methionine sulfoxide reductase B/A protein [Flavobacteriales bacterium]
MNAKLVFSLIIITTFFSCGKTQENHINSNKNKTEKMDKITQTEEQWKKQLTPEEYHILREKGTEKPGTGKLLHNKEKGIYVCAGCGNDLFTDEMKFDSHCGWPSFDREIKGDKITKQVDTSHGMIRTEIVCSNCGGHLGHLFDDGITETGQRYCVNSLSLDFIPEVNNEENQSEEIVLGGGCFWCLEAVFLELKGVEDAESGYAGGVIKNPTYKQVSSGVTGHAEVVKVKYNPKQITLREILEVFFTMHDPTTLNKQGADVGTQYRSVVFYTNEKQKKEAENIIEELEENNVFENKIVTEVVPLSNYSKAEDYHQDYYSQNKEQGYCRMVISPKLEKLKKVFTKKLKDLE